MCGARVADISRQPDRDEGLRERLVELASERPRFGYRRLGVLLARQGERVNHKRLFRVYRASGTERKAHSSQEAAACRALRSPFYRSRIRSGRWTLCVMRSAPAEPSAF